mmetsp:Transcript_25161/g.56593  ORF Transcript_25161/g.56593 Transcript_25161/m.56593 type:complete len:221 (+) Transcript_25161:989-1651(+)
MLPSQGAHLLYVQYQGAVQLLLGLAHFQFAFGHRVEVLGLVPTFDVSDLGRVLRGLLRQLLGCFSLCFGHQCAILHSLSRGLFLCLCEDEAKFRKLGSRRFCLFRGLGGRLGFHRGALLTQREPLLGQGQFLGGALFAPLVSLLRFSALRCRPLLEFPQPLLRFAPLPRSSFLALLARLRNDLAVLRFNIPKLRCQVANCLSRPLFTLPHGLCIGRIHFF